MNPVVIDRPPRIQPELPSGTHEIPKPPQRPNLDRMRLIQIGLPLLTVLGFVLVSSFSSARSSWLVLPMLLSIGASVAFSFYSYRKERQDAAHQARAYAERLVELHKELNTAHDLQRRFYAYNYPEPARLLPTIATAVAASGHFGSSGDPPGSLGLRSELRPLARVWERRAADADFGVVRLGVGTLPSTVRFTVNGLDDTTSPEARAALKLQADSCFVDSVPVAIRLRRPVPPPSDEPREQSGQLSFPFAPAIGVAGDREGAYAFARALLAHLVTFHTPADARLYVLAQQRKEWDWVVQLPHAQGDAQNGQICFVDDIEGGPADELFNDGEGDELEQYLERLRRLLAQRKIRLQDREGQEVGEDVTLPFCVVVVDLLDLPSFPSSRLNGIETDAAFSILVSEGGLLGAAVLFLLPDRGKVPGGCGAVIEVERTTPATNSRIAHQERLHFRYIEAGVNAPHYIGAADHLSVVEATDLARALSGLAVRQDAGANLASAVPFLDLMGYKSLQQLREDTLRRWNASIEPRQSQWLRVKLGRMAGNKPRTLVFSAKRDGVHGVVAGSTGSGKSELLVSLISGMAITYDPSVLNFVLVDYKGGGAFKEFEDLPHCVDLVTNLGGDGVTRMFTAINAELNRRQKLNTDTSTKNIVEYRQQGLHLSHEPYPFLFIIIDEFAEMIADRAEYRSQLERITRVGRAQGVSLLLAAQRPSGVTDQMRSNIKFRICLRVETQGESREMLRRPDAAYLPTTIPGRGYLQVGNEEIELIQVAYTGDRHREPDALAALPVIWPGRNERYKPEQDQPPLELYKVLIEMLADLARQGGRLRQSAPWPGFLPAQLTLTQALIDQDPEAPSVTSARYLVRGDVQMITMGAPAGATLSLSPSLNRWLTEQGGWPDQLDWERHALRPVVGLVDHPYESRQLPLTVHLPEGHVAIFGASGSGKTTFIRSLVVSLCASHRPDQLHIYILDLGGRSLQPLDGLPHVGAVISPDEEGYQDQVQQVIRELDAIIEQRKGALNLAGVDDIYAYNQRNPGTVMPAILLAIDNFVEFNETFGNEQDGADSALSKLITLARQSRAYGVHIVISASRMADLSNPLLNVFTERLALRMADPTEYRTLIGTSVDALSDLPGRGYIKIDRYGLAFQVAVPFQVRGGGEDAQTTEQQELAQWVATVAAYAWKHGLMPAGLVRVGPLPRSVLLKKLLADTYGLNLEQDIVPALREEVCRRWVESYNPVPPQPNEDRSNWPKVLIGTSAGGRVRILQLEAKRDGVHGMIAGGTGSGKSELLMTIVVSLALHYDPRMLNFVLVDYKGGGAFKPFEGLPHTVQTLTNLNSTAVRRMFTAITAEMRRRQALNVATKTKDIVDYHEQGLHRTHGSYPFLIVIIDEYAELISASPEFSNELDSITRLGRAQGVLLLLAAQRPVGVSDQMRANIKYRLCLRVEQADTSRELLRRPDAAFLPNGLPGRGYLQVGSEPVELLQVAYTGEDYPFAPPTERGELPKFFEVAVQLSRELNEERGAPSPWPQPLAPHLLFNAALDELYVQRDDQALLRLGQTAPLQVNPFVGRWLDEEGTWPGVRWGRSALRAVVGLIDDPANARLRPLEVDLARGHAVIFGASGWGKTTFVRSMVVSLAATHTPDELHIHLLDLGGRNLEALGVLPHVGTVVLPDERGYEERVRQLLREIGEEIAARKLAFSKLGVENLIGHNTRPGAELLPAILLIVDNFAEFIESFGSGRQQDDEQGLLNILIGLIRQGKAYGLHVVVTTTRLNTLSSKLYSLFTERFTLRLSDAGDYSAIVGGQVPDLEEVAGRGYTRVDKAALTFQVALLPGTVDGEGQVSAGSAQLRTIGVQMTRAAEKRGSRNPPLSIGALQDRILYRQILADLHKLDQSPGRFLLGLSRAVDETWQWTRNPANAGWLEVPFGLTSGNRHRSLHLEAQRDGVHGIIAGGTGSGKSELLMAIIVGLALRYPPDLLNFVLVDYKGGGAFKPFEGMPHCVDIVTNLNTAAVERMFTAISAEIRRRQALNVATGTKDIVDYRAKNLHRTREPYPHLFIIIDEYAEMIQENDAYLREIESITRVGRAQGVHLLLASQQPKGVTDQMRANIKYRLCLRVEQADTSRELLRRPDAAFLPNGMPGRGYIQVGNENIELVQVAYTGDKQPDDRPPQVLWPGRGGEAPRSEEEPPKFFDMVVTLTRELAHGVPAPRPWPAFLPERFSLETRLYDAMAQHHFTLVPAVTAWINAEQECAWPPLAWSELRQSGPELVPGPLRPVIGLLDDPANARQTPLVFDLSRAHLAIFGDTGTGKSTLLRTVLTSLAVRHSPDDLHAYVVDMGGRSFASLAGLPHVGAMIYGDEETFSERVERLLDLLTETQAERVKLMSTAGETSLWEYNERFPTQALPAILVCIDNITELQEGYTGLVENALIPLARVALNAGIIFAVSANAPNGLPNKLYSLFTERVTLRQANTDRYLEIVGRGASEIADIPGRGYLRRDRRPLAFQAALPAGVIDAGGRLIRAEASELEALATTMAVASTARRHTPRAITVLPERLQLARILDEAPPPGARLEAVLGMNNALAPELVDLSRLGPHFLIVGPPLSGKTTGLYNWMLSLGWRYAPDRALMATIDLQGRMVRYGGRQTLEALPHMLSCVTDVTQIESLVLSLRRACEAIASDGLGRSIFLFIDNLDDLAEELGQKAAALELSALIRQFGREMLYVVATISPKATSSDLRRRVSSSSFGLALRSEDSFNVLPVTRPPAVMRGKELPVGRGLRVKSGQGVLVQLASPYGELVVDEGDRAAALDRWMRDVRARYPGQKAAWPGAVEETPRPAAPANSHQALLGQMFAVLQAGMRRELLRAERDGISQPLLATELMGLSLQEWQSEQKLTELLRKLFIRERILQKYPEESVRMMAKSFGAADLIRELGSVVNEPA